MAWISSTGTYLLLFLDVCPFVDNIFSRPEALIDSGASARLLVTLSAETVFLWLSAQPLEPSAREPAGNRK